jgi:hypothetical protein
MPEGRRRRARRRVRRSRSRSEPKVKRNWMGRKSRLRDPRRNLPSCRQPVRLRRFVTAPTAGRLSIARWPPRIPTRYRPVRPSDRCQRNRIESKSAGPKPLRFDRSVIPARCASDGFRTLDDSVRSCPGAVLSAASKTSTQADRDLARLTRVMRSRYYQSR